MAFSVQMPALGESVTEGTVTRWLKQEGEAVELDEPLGYLLNCRHRTSAHPRLSDDCHSD